MCTLKSGKGHVPTKAKLPFKALLTLESNERRPGPALDHLDIPLAEQEAWVL